MHPPEQLVNVERGVARSTNSSENGVVDLEQLLRREGPRLLGYFARRVSPVEDAGDLLSQTMIVAWRRHDQIPNDEIEARMWLFGVARRNLSTYRRGVVRRNALADRLRQELAATFVPTPEYEIDAVARVAALRDAMGRLKKQDREVLTLVHSDGFTLTESAQLLNQRLATTRSRYYRARERLKALLIQDASSGI